MGGLLGRAEIEAHDPSQRAERGRLSERRQGRRKGVHVRRRGEDDIVLRLTASGLVLGGGSVLLLLFRTEEQNRGHHTSLLRGSSW